MPRIKILATVLCGLFLFLNSVGDCAPPASPEQMIAAKIDLWGEAALALADGPTYDYFASLIPPIRYVDARFHHYPIMLSAPGSTVKGRLISNGSQFNALAKQPNWLNEMGIPVYVLVGPHRLPFGDDLKRLDGPHYMNGYLPVVQLKYECEGVGYSEEVFAGNLDGDLVSSGALLARFSFPAAADARLELQFEGDYEYMTGKEGMLRDSSGRLLANFDDNWELNQFRNALTIKRGKRERPASVAIYTIPLDASTTPTRMNADLYDRKRSDCTKQWDDILARGMRVEVPEPYVNDAWRSLVVGIFGMTVGDKLNYSAGNQYARMYASETGDAMRALLLWGYTDDVKRLMPPLLRKRRTNMEFHYAGFELQSLAENFFRTHDRDLIEKLRPEWESLLTLIENGRESASGMLPREKYCTDIDTLVYNLKSNTACWRGVRDMALLLEDIGETNRSQALVSLAADYRKTILAVMDKATSHAIDPPFLPIALGGEEDIHDPITGTRIGSYWNLVIGYVLATGVFPYDSQRATDILRYQQTHGGICMGMIRNLTEPTWWLNTKNIDDLYGIRYALLLQQRDEVDQALVSFYGKLAQGMTRDTFIDGESTSIMPYDEFGRQVYLPPNSTANASFLQQLRCLLVQDWDMDADGRADTLRLLFATPRAWLADGKSIHVERAPTMFGNVSMHVVSKLAAGRIDIELELPARPPREILLRLRLPGGAKVLSARSGSHDLTITNETIDLAGLTGHQQIDVRTQQP